MGEHRAVWASLLLLGVACGGNSKATAPQEPGPDADRDRGLWVFAPTDLDWGMVIPDGRVEPFLKYMKDGAAAWDETWGSTALATSVDMLFRYHGVDLKEADQRGAVGFDPNGGYAQFHVPGDVISVYSIPDVDAYRKRFGVVTKTTPSGPLDVDREGSYCAAVDQRYVCAASHQRVAAYRDQQKAGLTWPQDMAGDVQVYLSPERLGPANLVVSNSRGLHLSARLRPGALNMQLLLRGTALAIFPRRGGPTDLVAHIPQDNLRSAGYVDLRGPWRALKPHIRQSWAGGAAGELDAEELIDSLRGDMAVYSSFREQTPVTVVLVGFDKDRALARVLRDCEDIVDINPDLQATRIEGACRLSWNELSQVGFRWLDVKTADNALIFEFTHAGFVSPRASSSEQVLTQMKNSPYPVFVWSAGISRWMAEASMVNAASLTDPMEQLGAAAFFQLCEAIVAARASDDGLHAELDISTVWTFDNRTHRQEVSQALFEVVQGKIDAFDRLEQMAKQPDHGVSGLVAQHGVWAPHLALGMVATFFYTIHSENETTDAMTSVLTFEQISARACECSDDECRVAVHAEWDEWLSEYGETQINHGQARRIEEAAAEMRECLGMEPE